MAGRTMLLAGNAGLKLEITLNNSSLSSVIRSLFSLYFVSRGTHTNIIIIIIIDNDSTTSQPPNKKETF
jgi:hypothetical protein